MFKSEMNEMVKRAGGMSDSQEIEFSLIHGQKASLKVGQSWTEASSQWGGNPVTVEIVGFAAPQARGRISKWDDDAEVPSVILKSDAPQPNAEYEIRSAWDCRKGFAS